MATAKSTAPEGSKEWLHEKVTVKLFKDNGAYSADVFVGVNGHTWNIKRGVPVEVPRYVALVLEQSQAERENAAMNQERIQADLSEFSRSNGIMI